jgi:hypothetical protein
LQRLVDAAIMFCGTQDQIYDQLTDFCDYCRTGNLLMMGHAGSLSHEEATDNITLFARKVLDAEQSEVRARLI